MYLRIKKTDGNLAMAEFGRREEGGFGNVGSYPQDGLSTCREEETINLICGRQVSIFHPLAGIQATD